ncbi:MAG: RICIN domain-containing protein [Rhodothermales bacterium]
MPKQAFPHIKNTMINTTYSLVRALLVVSCLGVGLLAAATATAQSGGWQVHEGTAARHNFGTVIPNGDTEGFLSGSQIPASNDSGWSNVSNDQSLRWSGPGGTPCRAQANYTYFETFVLPGPDEGFAIDFTNVDDAARVTVFAGEEGINNGVNVPDLVGLRESKTVDLSPYLKSDDVNRIVITLADVCGAGNGLSAQVRSVPGAGGSEIAANEGTPTESAPTPGTWYLLKSMSHEDAECLESNGRGGQFGGNAVMTPCRSQTGQLWQVQDAGNGYYRLKSSERGEGECFESNSRESDYMGGSAYMDDCQNVSGQLWKVESADNGFYRLKSMFRGENECLEANGRGSDQMGGTAFMDDCQNVTGQLWRFDAHGPISEAASDY